MDGKVMDEKPIRTFRKAHFLIGNDLYSFSLQDGLPFGISEAKSMLAGRLGVSPSAVKYIPRKRAENMIEEEALANLQKGAGLAGQPLEFFEPNH